MEIMDVFVESINDQTLSIPINATTTVDDLKSIIYSRINYKYLRIEQWLINPNGEKLEDGHLLSTYNIANNSTIYLVINKRGVFSRLIEPNDNDMFLTIDVKTLTGESYKISIDDRMTVDDLKRFIQVISRNPHKDQLLIHMNCGKLEVGNLLSNYNITNNSTVYLVINKRGVFSRLIGPNDMFRTIDVKTLIGESYEISIDDRMTVYDLKSFIQVISGIPPDQQRLIFDGKQLCDDDLLLTTYGVIDGSIIHMILKLRGMISRFTGTDPWLGATDEFRQNNPLSVQDCQHLMDRKKASKEDDDFFRTDINISPVIQHRFRTIIDQFHREHGSPTDLKLVINDPCIELFKTLMDLHPNTHKDYLKIALRRTDPTDNCIEFHVDGEYAFYTVACVLNNDHVGGDVVFVKGDPPTVVNEHLPVGAVTVHHRSILHGVTRLINGVRYRIFVVEKNNGLGQTDVHDITDTFMTKWNRQFVSDTLTDRSSSHASSMMSSCETHDSEKDANHIDLCVICFTNKRTHLLIPCGHYAYCQSCVDKLSNKCALCCKHIESTQCVYIC